MEGRISAAAARLMIEYPVLTARRNKETVTLSPEEYEARIQRMARAVVEQEDRVSAKEQKMTQLQTVLTELEAGTATNRQVQTVVARLVKRELDELGIDI